MTTLSAVIKKELKQTFPEIKFSVTTRNGDVSVKWELPLGTDATVAAVKAICNKHQTVVHHGDLMNDTAWSSGSSVYTNPEYTQERKDWALEQTKARNFAGATWNERYQRFEEADGGDAYHATKQYREYLENGVSSALVTEYGGEPWAKHWYYETLKKEEAQAESAPIEPETIEVKTPEPEKKAIVPVSIQTVDSPVFIESNFPSQNKQCSIDAYYSQPAKIGKAQIVKIVELTPEDYHTFIHELFGSHDWLKGEGGCGSHYQSKYGDDYDKLFNDEEEAAKWRRESYVCAVAVTDGKDYILVNPEGYNYARYAGFGTNQTLSSLLKLAQVQLSSAFAVAPTEPIAPETDRKRCVRVAKEIWPTMFDAKEVESCIEDSANTVAPAAPETNLILFPSPKQPEVQPAAQTQSHEGDSFYLQSYQAWVDKLVARGEYGKLKSFDEWYAIAVDVM